MAGAIATETLPVFMRLKVKGFLNKEKKDFIEYSGTFNMELKEPELKFEPSHGIRLLENSLQQETLSVKLKKRVPDNSRPNSYRPAGHGPENTSFFQLKPSNFKSAVPLNTQASFNPGFTQQEDNLSSFNSQLDGILKSCSKLNRAMYHVEKRLTKTESKFFTSMTNLLVKTKKGPKFKSFSKDPIYLEKKRLMEEELERDALKEKDKKEPFKDLLSNLLPQRKEEHPRPVIDRIRSLSSVEHSDQTSPKSLNVNFKPVLTLNTESMSPRSTKPTKHLSTISLIPMASTDGTSPRIQNSPRKKSFKFPTSPNAGSPFPKFVTNVSEEALYKQLDEISKAQDRPRSYKLRNKATMKLATYAVQDEDFLKLPTPKLQSTKSRLSLLDVSPNNLYAKGSPRNMTRANNKKKKSKKQLQAQEAEQAKTEEKPDPSKIVLIKRQSPASIQIKDLAIPKLLTKEKLDSYRDLPESSPLMRYLNSIPVQDRHYRRDTVAGLIETIESANQAHFSVRKRKSESIAVERLLSGMALTPKAPQKFIFPTSGKTLI